jgi:beta-glucosidase
MKSCLSAICSILSMPVLSFAADVSFYPPVDPRAPFTPTVQSLVSQLRVDEKITLVHWATDPDSLGQAGYNPGVPRLGIPPRRDADALGINGTANATALPPRLGLGATFDRNIVYPQDNWRGMRDERLVWT